ncbi:hypothetical protein Drorol1_Dr00016796 [Drosera rotundifolia]
MVRRVVVRRRRKIVGLGGFGAGLEEGDAVFDDGRVCGWRLEVAAVKKVNRRYRVGGFGADLALAREQALSNFLVSGEWRAF